MSDEVVYRYYEWSIIKRANYTVMPCAYFKVLHQVRN
jgi:hypothetical protein